MINKNIFAAIAIVASGVLLAACTPAAPTPTTDQSNDQTSQTNATPIAGEMQDGTSKAFTVTGNNFAFDTKEIRVKEGDTVKVTFVNSEGTHDWALDEFNVKTAMLQAGGTETIEFVANKKGEFEYYCSFGQHRQMGMVGKLIVE